MYSGWFITNSSGRFVGAHQKIDRVARRNLVKLAGDDGAFPTLRNILQFEGKNGPDGIKKKSPAKDEPWHYYDPYSNENNEILDHILNHYNLLVKHLGDGNSERAAFEAAWLAHAIADGLTPAHHYPYEEKLGELRGGLSKESRTTIKGKLIMPGGTKSEKVKNNWMMWGPKGLMVAHGMFELGVSSIILPLSFNKDIPKISDISVFREIGIIQHFKNVAKDIASLDMYERFLKTGWTTKLTLEVRQILAPLIIRAVTLAWYSALVDAGLITDENNSG